MAGIFLIGFIIPVVVSLYIQFFFPDFFWHHLLFHGIIEAVGAFAAFVLAGTMLFQQRIDIGENDRLFISYGLIGMGFLDGVHAFFPPGNDFVWLHSTATLVGGFFFFLMLLPQRVVESINTGFRQWRFLCLAVVCGVILLMAQTGQYPTMQVQGVFTPAARAINILGGLCFMASALRFMIFFYKNGGLNTFLFAALSLYFGMAGVLFEFSQLWDTAWWFWHLLRLFAYLITLVYIFASLKRYQSELLMANRTAEKHLSDLNQTMAALNQSNRVLKNRTAALERSNKDLEQFVYIASHDLQEPLRKVGSFMELLAERYGDRLDRDAHEYINYAVDGARRMKALINDLLTYSRIETRAQTVKPMDSMSAINKALQDLELTIHEKKADVSYNPLPAITADAYQLKLLFYNLIDNAIKFNSRKPVRVKISAEQHDKIWRFAIHDNGIGIESRYHERIFKMFQRLHGMGEYAGNGIGLAICKKIVERHGGIMGVESIPGQGSTFYFTIPDLKEDH